MLDGYLLREGAPSFAYDAGSASYQQVTDEIHLPPVSAFRTSEGLYSTAFHELGHSTGHKSRLARPELMTFTHHGDKLYAKEELVAEMTAAILSARTGIENGEFEQSAAYIASWLGALRNDKKLVISAAAAAQKAVELIAPEVAENETGTDPITDLALARGENGSLAPDGTARHSGVMTG